MYKPKVSLKEGKIRGSVVPSVLGSSYIAFFEIPYAAPPVGKLRFKRICHECNKYIEVIKN